MDHTKHICLWLCLLCCTIAAHAFPTGHYAASSRLAQGRWVKIKVTQSGIHEITADDARAWGFADLSNLHVFGTGGPISEALTADIPDDLPQLPTVRTSSRLLFYAQGSTRWTAGTLDVPFLQVQHPYSSEMYYLVTDDRRFSDTEPERATNSPDGTQVTTFTEHICHETDIVNPGETGRIYLGEDFLSRPTQTFAFNLTDRVSGTEVIVHSSFGTKIITGSTKLTFQQNNNNLPTVNNDGAAFTTATQDDPYQLIRSTKRFTPSDGNQLNYTIKAAYSGNVSLARIDFVTVNYTRRLALSAGRLAFDINHSAANVQVNIAGATAVTQVWDVTQPWKPIVMATVASTDGVRFSPVESNLRNYIAFNTEGVTYPRPSQVGVVANQNLHAMPTPDMLIISPPEYIEQAQRIADMHQSRDSMRVTVVNHNLIFNEFSGGTPDVLAYRMLCKMLYDRGADSTGHRLQYLLLMGKGVYDNRLLSPTIRALNAPMLLLWEKEGGNSHSGSYCSDDIIATLDDDTPAIFYRNPLSIAVGRMPVKSVAEAKIAVDKLINYVTKPDYGVWKTQMLNVADDENEGIHMQQSDADIAAFKENGGSDMFYNRVYLDAYQAVSSGANRTYPQATAKQFNTLRSGVLWWNYTGHSGPHAMTDNGLLRHSDLNTKFYYKHLPILFGATCDFAMFDGSDESAGETLFLNPRGGVIALVCPPRQVTISGNGPLNVSVARNTFIRDNQKPRRLGDIIRLGKNNNISRDENRARFFIFGDPAMPLPYPEHKIIVDSLVGARETDTHGRDIFCGRQTMTVRGHIADINGNRIERFNGSITSTVYDYEQSVTSNGNGKGIRYTYLDRTNRLAISIDSVRNGQFSARITLPSELLPREVDSITLYDNFSPSLISMYAYSATDSLEAMGHYDNFIIYGYDDQTVTDTIGPEISYFGLNSENFKDGDQVNESPQVIAAISDNTGINYSTAGIGHSMTLTLDGNTSYNDLLDYFTPRSVDTGQSGTLAYKLNDLAEGPHTLRLRAWDVFNNVGEKTISFTVVKGLKPEIFEVYATSSPASVETTFYVKHNRPDALLQVTIEVFNLMGKLVWSTSQSGTSDTYTSFPITWNLSDASGRRLPRGIYIYRATISTDGIQQSTKSKKLAITGE